MKKKGIVKTIGGIVIAVVVAAVGVSAWKVYYDRKVPNFQGATELYVYPGTTPEAVLKDLETNCKVRSVKSLRRTMQREGAMESMQAGHYRVDSTCSSTYVARMLRKGWQTPVNLTLSGSIRSLEALSRKIGNQMLADSAEVLYFLADPDSLAPYGIEPERVFCFIVPDTYQIKWTASVREIMDRLVKERNDFWTPERLEKARRQGLTADEAVVLASIVDGETHDTEEQPIVAGVYLNRLRIGMKLQADPTVAYCFGYKLKRILKRHLEYDSPYNTYLYQGLPPGPISCPPKSCIEAVLNPARHNYLYFCADPSLNGKHRFAATYTEHQRNAAAYQKAISRL